jgi:hypothetical protein
MENENYFGFWEKAIVYLIALVYLIVSAQGARAFLYYWFDSLMLVASIDKTRYSRLKMARPNIKKSWRDLMVRQAQETKADHIGFWLVHTNKNKLYISMAGEYSDSQKLAGMRLHGQKYELKEIQELFAAANTLDSFVYAANPASSRRMDAVTSEFFKSSLVLPFKEGNKLYFITVASWVCKDVANDYESGKMAPAIEETKALNRRIHNLIKNINP